MVGSSSNKWGAVRWSICRLRSFLHHQTTVIVTKLVTKKLLGMYIRTTCILITVRRRCMDMNDAAETFCCMANLPLQSNVLQMMVLATQMPFVGRG